MDRAQIENLVFLSADHEPLRHLRLYAVEYAQLRADLIDGIMAGKTYAPGSVGEAVAAFVNERLAQEAT